MPVALEGGANRQAMVVAPEGGRPGPARPQPAGISIEDWWTEFTTAPPGRRRDHARDRLVTHYMATQVRPIAARVHGEVPRQVERDDLEQQGYFGLVTALERFDPDRGIRFETFAAPRIYGAMRDYLRALDLLPRLGRARARKLRRIQESFSKAHGRPPCDEELRERLGLSDRQYRNLQLAARPASMVSLASGRDGDDDDTDAMVAFADRTQRSPLSEAEREDLKRWVTAGFSRRDRLIIILYYYERMTMKMIGEAVGCSESRVSQRLEAILGCLRSRLATREDEEEFVLT